MGAIDQLLHLFETWHDPKMNSTMFRKDPLKEWSSIHFVECG
jgi:hypothetical protein